MLCGAGAGAQLILCEVVSSGGRVFSFGCVFNCDPKAQCLSWGYHCCDKTPRADQLGEERVYLAYASTSLSIIEGSQDGTLGAGADDVEAMKGRCLLACCSGLAQLRCLTEPRSTSPGMNPPKTAWATPDQSLIKTISSILWRHFSQLRFPSFR